MRPSLLAPLLALSLGLACGKSESPPAPSNEPAPNPSGMELARGMKPSTPPPAAPAPEASKGSCEVTVEGDMQASGTSPGGPAAVGTDYWLTPEELDKAIEMMVNALEKDKTKAAEAIAKAKADPDKPKIMLLMINCTSDKVKLTIGAGGDSKYKDVPFGPGKYVLGGGRVKPGQFSAMLSLDQQFFSAGEGTLDISKFDATGIAGTFEFPAKLTDYATKASKSVTVKGKFDYPCATSSKVCKR